MPAKPARRLSSSARSGLIDLLVEGALTAMLALGPGTRAEAFASCSKITVKVLRGRATTESGLRSPPWSEELSDTRLIMPQRAADHGVGPEGGFPVVRSGQLPGLWGLRDKRLGTSRSASSASG